MQIDKQQIIVKLTELGHQDKAAQADKDLPDQVDTDQVDTDQDADLLDKLGINMSDLLGGTAGKFGL